MCIRDRSGRGDASCSCTAEERLDILELILMVARHAGQSVVASRYMCASGMPVSSACLRSGRARARAPTSLQLFAIIARACSSVSGGWRCRQGTGTLQKQQLYWTVGGTNQHGGGGVDTGQEGVWQQQQPKPLSTCRPPLSLHACQWKRASTHQSLPHTAYVLESEPAARM